MSLIALNDADKTGYPNLALMKLSAWHKKKGDKVCQYVPLLKGSYDKIYSSKVFTFTKSFPLPSGCEKGGYGHEFKLNRKIKRLPDKIEHIKPDYSLYDCDRSYGFLTRGCPNNCPWCVVPKMEGDICAHADVEEFLAHLDVVLMDNNVLAHNHGIEQIEKMARLGLKVDFNQGLDARLIDDGMAKRLSKLKWLSPVRMACDAKSQMKHIQKAVTLLRWHNTKPTRFFIYVLVKDIDSALERVKFLKGMYLDPFAQPYIDEKREPTQEQQDFARWVNHKAIFGSVPWKEYRRSARKEKRKQKGFGF